MHRQVSKLVAEQMTKVSDQLREEYRATLMAERDDFTDTIKKHRENERKMESQLAELSAIGLESQ